MIPKILNLTQHEATPEQIAQGVVEPHDKAVVRKLLTFDSKPTVEEIIERAAALAGVARTYFGPQFESEDCPCAMIGGAPFLMGPLERALRRVAIHPEYAFSVRESVEIGQPDGNVLKTAVFRHAGFILAIEPWEEGQDEEHE